MLGKPMSRPRPIERICREHGSNVKSVNSAGYCPVCAKKHHETSAPFSLVSFCASVLASRKRERSDDGQLELIGGETR